jgi:metal-dependent amidase/aminoacylase/carboxypeptidase family protein
MEEFVVGPQLRQVAVVGSTLAAPHHRGHFDIDEESLPVAVELLERIAPSASH